MRIDVLTLFPEMFEGPLSESILKQAREKGLLDVRLTNVRDFARDRHRTADDYQYGGGSGMVMKPEPIFEALEHVGAPVAKGDRTGGAVVLMSARGRLFDHGLAADLAREPRLVLICGRYKGVDERVAGAATHEVSIGDYVLSGGELAAMVVVDAVARLLPGVLGDMESAETDSFYEGILGPPVYTRPEEYRGEEVPDVLKSGHHEMVRRWRRKEALKATLHRRPDLLERAELTDEDRELLQEIEAEDNTI
ncbi:MAG: tRNA (guanosine(37)-N1)-methyltransferase TrmD [Candidatus Eisenbacteria bacterium]|nr:tRNA (guanosine(37)-N1)-methyltransferase TrmD [Candidatus Eisenbacteria bacterium]